MKKDMKDRISRMKMVYIFSAVTSFILGIWTVIHPTSFWGTIGISGSDPLVQVIYGGAICGEGFICSLGYFRPLRYSVILQYMIAYKAVAVAGLAVHLFFMAEPPVAGWIIALAWAAAGIQAAWAYPWGKWDEMVDAILYE